jgi:hypothetical protein
MNSEYKESMSAFAIVAVLGVVIATILAGAYEFGIIVPILFFLSGALVGGIIGWIIALPFKSHKQARTIGAYAMGIIFTIVGNYRAAMADALLAYRDAVLRNYPSTTDNQWYSIRESAIQEVSPLALHKVFVALVVVIGWVALYWCAKFFIRKVSGRSRAV